MLKAQVRWDIGPFGMLSAEQTITIKPATRRTVKTTTKR